MMDRRGSTMKCCSDPDCNEYSWSDTGSESLEEVTSDRLQPTRDSRNLLRCCADPHCDEYLSDTGAKIMLLCTQLPLHQNKHPDLKIVGLV